MNTLPFSAAGTVRPFMIFVTDEIYLGQLFDVFVYRKRFIEENECKCTSFFLKASHRLQQYLYEIILTMKHMLQESSNHQPCSRGIHFI